MVVRTNDIFDSFHCTMGGCSDNCCRIGWDIEIDDDTYDYYRSLDSELGRRLVESIYEEEGCRYMSQPRGCPFMNEEGLCSVQLECGEEHISDICREHPRFYEWFGEVKEAGVGLSCEEAAGLLMKHEKPILFYDIKTQEEADDLEFDRELFTPFRRLRDRLIEILQDRGLSVRERLGIVLFSSDDIQQAVFEGDADRIRQISGMLAIDGFRVEMINHLSAEKYEDKLTGTARICELMGKMDYIGEGLKKVFELSKEDIENILRCERSFEREYHEFSHELENLGVYYIYRYLLKAMRDSAVDERIYAAVFCVLAVRLAFLAEYAKNGTLPDLQRRIWLVKEFSKEIEYSVDNMDMIYEEIQTGKISTSMLAGLLF